MCVVFYVDEATGGVRQVVESDIDQPEIPGTRQVIGDRWIPPDRAEYRDGRIVERVLN